MKAFKKIFFAFLRVGISIILLIFLFKQVDNKSLLEIIKNADKFLLVSVFFIFCFTYLLALLRWEMLLKAAQIHLSLKRIIISFSGGLFFNLFLPTAVGGDLVRSLDLSTHTKRPREVIATVLLDRLSGYVALVLVALLALGFGWRFLQDRSVLIPVFIITALLASILLVLFNRFLYSKINKLLHSPTAGRIREAIKNLHHEMHIFRHHKDILVDNLIFSLVIQILGPVTFYLIALSLGLKINIIYFFIFVPIISAISLLPISIGGLGLRDASIVFFFAKTGVGQDLALAMSLLYFSFILIYGILGGFIYVLAIHHRRIQRHKPPAVLPRP
ncbi:MAG: flippase-like domain-containing protein [Candidatus Omnitrophica bacterium]|nr:flippase-like domain-containing protein [Candidatus Omnitrophota bacterium]MBU4472689.1 flippase-like domain-containing protein [Candidatus Omnitrophota bacterium]MCG2705970.1 flippase-like domain-containing protein [Candidatus Omnitrophota bacterium]